MADDDLLLERLPLPAAPARLALTDRDARDADLDGDAELLLVIEPLVADPKRLELAVAEAREADGERDAVRDSDFVLEDDAVTDGDALPPPAEAALDGVLDREAGEAARSLLADREAEADRLGLDDRDTGEAREPVREPDVVAEEAREPEREADDERDAVRDAERVAVPVAEAREPDCDGEWDTDGLIDIVGAPAAVASAESPQRASSSTPLLCAEPARRARSGAEPHIAAHWRFGPVPRSLQSWGD